jgi:hypothetical protein
VGERETVGEHDGVVEGTAVADARGDCVWPGLLSFVRVRRNGVGVGDFEGARVGTGLLDGVGERDGVSVGASTEIVSEIPFPIAPRVSIG